jgi:KDO2-lipid IV(A) lauroyltransferase
MLLRIFRFFSVFPLPLLHALGVGLGWLVYLLSPSYRRRMRTNLRQAGFSGQLQRAVGEAGKAIAELPFIWCADPQRVSDRATVENWDLVQQYLDAGKGIVFLTPHLGCFEITAQEIAHRTELMVMYRPPRKEAMKPLIEGARARKNLLLAPANMGGVRMLAKFLKKGQPIGLLPQEGEGVWAEFFGRSAYTMTLPAKMAQLGDAVILIVYAERLPGGKGYVVRFVPFEAALEGDSAAQARAINAEMEKLIARCPAQYYWSYNRYKVPAGVAAAPSAQEPA